MFSHGHTKNIYRGRNEGMKFFRKEKEKI
jgi:hypothetical protein